MSAVLENRDGRAPRRINRPAAAGRLTLGGIAFVAAVLCGAASVGAQARPRGDNDLQVGDRIVLKVDGEPLLTDTFTVVRGPVLVLPIVGSVSLAGVRRDSVEKVLSDAVARYYRLPTVHARVLVRVAVLGEVARPGFYSVPTDVLVPDVVMAAGGPTPTAQVNQIRVTRLGADLMSRDSIQSAIAQGRTLSQIDVRSEDQFLVPRAADSERVIRLVSLWLTIPLAIVTLIYFTRR
jgi:protein involved in polysaccharide export with SLBB domain